VKSYYGRVFDLEPRLLAVVHAVVDNSLIEQRHFVMPVEEIIVERSLGERNTLYREWSIKLGSEAAHSALARAGLTPSEVDVLITVSCTGFMIPSLDAVLMNEMGFRRDVRRLPVTELGCGAGAAGLAMARDFIMARGGGTALLIAVEVPSLTFQPKDSSGAHLVSCALFGDGAAAAVVTSHELPGPVIRATSSYTFPNSLDAMGFDLRDAGFHIILSKDVPALVRNEIREVTAGFLAACGIRFDQLSFFVLHPGGQKLLKYVEEELGINSRATASAWHVMARYGNLSSATVLFVLDEELRSQPPPPGSLGLAVAFGPGFTGEFLLLECP
jgi:alkylresorcinol/alkylpyrone synthase